MQKVASFRDAYQAHILKGALEASGIPAYIQDEQLATINWMYSQAIGGVKVYVPEEFFEKAIQLIEEIKVGNGLEKALEDEAGILDLCPNCGSKSLEPTRYSLWSLIPIILTWTPFFLGRKKWQCKVCGHKI
jgi:hypothetical protein